jgi:hypothetical protein
MQNAVLQQNGTSSSVEIGQRPEGWILYCRHQSEEWINLKLVSTNGRGIRKERNRKRNWWLAWNGERLANNTDAGKLNEHHPEIYAWVRSRPCSVVPQVTEAHVQDRVRL